MDIITGYTGTPHITSAQDRDANQGSYGTGSYILGVGNKLSATVVNSNTIRINSGILSHQGCLGSIALGSTEDLTIANGAQGMKRRDLIVCRYTRDSSTGVESLELVVIQGTATSGTPSDPSYNTGNIQSGASPVDFPLYRVSLSGTTASTTRMATILKTQAEMDTLLGSTPLTGIANGTVTGALAINELGIPTVSASDVTSVVHKIGRICVFRIALTPQSDVLQGSTLATIPAGYRPLSVVLFPGYVLNTGTVWFSLGTDGTLSPFITISAGNRISISGVFMS